MTRSRRAGPKCRAEQGRSAFASIAPGDAPPDAPLPPFGSVGPQLATLVKSVPTSGSWIYELKYDGYRAMAWVLDGTVRIASRRGLDWTACYSEIATALSHVRVRSAIFDGEVAYVLDDGRTDFQKLQTTLGSRSPKERAHIFYFVFDLLHRDGIDLRGEPLWVRRHQLRTLLAGEGPPLKMSDDVSAEYGPSFFREACKRGLEGVIGKRADRPYRSGRSTDWIKIKCQKRQELIIVGFTPVKGTRGGLGALLLGLLQGGELRYAGKVGTGFSSETLRDLTVRLPPLVVNEPPVVDPPRVAHVRWVKPQLVAQVRFAEWTEDGVLRQPSFEGLRLDKPASDVHREVEHPMPNARSIPKS